MAVLTNKPGESSRLILDYFGILSDLVVTIGGGDIKELKPNPEGLFLCMEKAGVSKEQTWMMGDHYTDLSVAENAGVRSIFARYGFGETRGFVPTKIVDSFSEMVDFIGK